MTDPTPAQPPAMPPAQPPDWNPARSETGRFLPGHGGRKPGSKNRKSADALSKVQDLSDAAIAKLAVLVSQGSMSAIKYVLDVTLPRGGRAIDLDGTTNPHDLIEAVTNGTISPDEFARISQGWKTAIDAAELKDIKAQVEELEQLVSALRK